jgi:osmotically-inducible protein OsmY
MATSPNFVCKARRERIGALMIAGALAGCASMHGGQMCGQADCTADSQVTSAVQSSLDQHPEFGPPGQLQVETLNHVVYLYGSVADDLQLALARSVAMNAGGDAKIVSSIGVTEK